MVGAKLLGGRVGGPNDPMLNARQRLAMKLDQVKGQVKKEEKPKLKESPIKDK